jgi:hypothetical protein
LRLCRVPTAVKAVRIERSGAAGRGVVVRRGRAERTVPRGVLRMSGGQGSLLLLVVGGAAGVQDVRLVLTA